MKSITMNKTSKAMDDNRCLICETTFVGDVFIPCKTCTDEYLVKGVLLVESAGLVGNPETQKPTGRLMIIRDIAFEQVFNQSIPDGNVVKVEVGILQKMEDHINSHKN